VGDAPSTVGPAETHLVELWRAGKHTRAELAELFSVARSTVYRAVQRAGEPKKTGLSNDEIAGRLFLSPLTSKTHVSRIMRSSGSGAPMW
jgi:DNA-binding CsgD family transcriptional regulator